jgi:hypothetical protein
MSDPCETCGYDWLEGDAMSKEIDELRAREYKLYYLLSEWHRYYTAPDGNVKAFRDLVRDTQNILGEIGELYLNEAYLANQADQRRK